jgi:hypothetical protein
VSDEYQYVPTPVPSEITPEVAEYLALEFGNLGLAMYQKIGLLGQDGSWEDYLGSLSSAKVAGANVPTWSTVTDGINAYEFSATAMKELWINIHIKHDYKQGSMIYPHVHWLPSGTDTGDVRWGIEYSIAKGYSQEAFPSSTTIFIEQAGSGTANMHQIAEPTEGNGILDSSIEVDSVIMMRVFRDGAHANDTLTDTAFGIMVDIHYQMERVGTPHRNSPFY